MPQLTAQQSVIVNKVIAAMSQPQDSFLAAYQEFEDSELFSFELFEQVCMSLGLA